MGELGGFSEEQIARFGLTVGVGAFILYMLFIIAQLARESKAGRFGTFVLFVVLAFGIFGFVAKNIIGWVLGLSDPTIAASMSNLPALILAAGRGERLRPITDHTPKPLLNVRGKRLIEWQLDALARAQVPRAVVNTAWLEEAFEPVLGHGERFGIPIRYSMEGRTFGGALETAGGLRSAWTLLGEPQACWVVAGDAWLPDFDFDADAARRFVAGDDEIHLWFVPNPPHHPRGDFVLDAGGRVRDPAHEASVAGTQDVATRYTYATVGLFKFASIAHLRVGERAALRPALEAAIARGRVGGSLYRGAWADVGTEARWRELDAASPMTFCDPNS